MGAKKQLGPERHEGEFTRGEFLWRWVAEEVPDSRNPFWCFEIWRVPGEDFGTDLPDEAYDERAWKGTRPSKDGIKQAMAGIVAEHG